MTFFDLCATALFIGAAGLFLHRLQYEDTPLAPYVVVVLGCALGNWAGDAISAVTGTVLLVASGFLLVHLASQPFTEEDDASEA